MIGGFIKCSSKNKFSHNLAGWDTKEDMSTRLSCGWGGQDGSVCRLVNACVLHQPQSHSLSLTHQVGVLHSLT